MSHEAPEIEDGDLVIGIAEDGTPFVAWAGEPAAELVELAEQIDPSGDENE